VRSTRPIHPTVEEIVAAMRAVGDRPDGHRLRALIVLLRRLGLRISEALALQESDLDRGRGAVLVRRGKGGKRREVGMDRWAWNSSARGSRSAASYRSERSCA
jgi:site-specific recombinase XerD